MPFEWRGSRHNLPYISGIISFTLLSGHFSQGQQILYRRDGPALRLFDERIQRPKIGPRRRQIRGVPVLRDVIHPPLTPAGSQIDQLKALAAPRVKGMRYGEKPFCFVRLGCSAHTRPKEKSNALTKYGNGVCRRFSAPKPSSISKTPMLYWTNCEFTATKWKNIARSVPPQKQLGIWPKSKTDPRSGLRPNVLGGLMCSAKKLPCEWAMTAKSSLASNAFPSTHLPEVKSFAVSIPMATSPS